MWKSRCFFAVLMVAVAAMFFASISLAEPRKCSGTGKRIAIPSQSKLVVGDIPRHKIQIVSFVDIWESSDCEEYNGIKHVGVAFIDTIVGKGGNHVGYHTEQMKNGDKEFWKAEGSGELKIKEGGGWEIVFKGKMWSVGGTGAYSNIKVKGTYEGKATAQGLTYNWEKKIER